MPGLCTWRVPAPSRGGPLYSNFKEVPEELRTGRHALRPEMFSASEEPFEGSDEPQKSPFRSSAT